MSELIGALRVTLGLDSAAFQRGAARVEKRALTMQQRVGAAAKGFSGATGLALGLGAAAVGAAVGALAKNAFDMASALDESAQKMGVSVEALQELNLAATQSGISQESLAGAMAKLNKNMGLLEQGSGPAVKAFAKIGLAAEDLKGKSPDQALAIIADRLNQLPTVQERVAVGSQLMGRGFSELLPLINLGSAGLEKYAEASRKQGQITTEEAKRLDELSDSWERFKVTLGVATAKIIAMFAEMASKFDAFTVAWWKWRDNAIASAQGLAVGVVGWVRKTFEGIKSWLVDKVKSLGDGFKKNLIDPVINATKHMYDVIVGHSIVPDMVDDVGAEFDRLAGEMIPPSQDAADGVIEAFDSMVERSPLQQWADSIPQTAGQINTAFQAIQAHGLDALGDAITDVIMGTKSLGKAFKEVAAQIIADLVRMTVRMLIFKAISSALGGLFGGSGGGDLPVSGLDPGSLFKPTGFATGGGFSVLGNRGTDRNVLALNGLPIANVSHGERVNVGRGTNDNAPAMVEIVLRDELLDAKITQGAGRVVLATAPTIIDKARQSTIRSAGRRRLG